ncbi:MAG: NAD(P)-dependent oxidoreductase [Dehalococcoidia bacterium]
MNQKQDTAERAAGTQRVFLTGATGAMGQAIVRDLVGRGHEVTGVTRSAEGASLLRALGATPIEVDLFDARALTDAVRGADAIAHFATSIPRGMAAARRGAWRTNDRLRLEGTASLLEAARGAGVPRFIFESISLAYPDGGEDWLDESTPLAPVSPVMESAVEAEAMIRGFAQDGGEAVVLRFGRLYGPGRASGDLIEAVQRRRMPVIGSGENLVSSVHVDDVGRAVGAALEVVPGTYNVVDDAPETQRALLEGLASALDAPLPRRLPRPLARMMLGASVRVLTVSHRVSNRRFRQASGWAPRHPSAIEAYRSVAAAGGLVPQAAHS